MSCLGFPECILPHESFTRIFRKLTLVPREFLLQRSKTWITSRQSGSEEEGGTVVDGVVTHSCLVVANTVEDERSRR